MRYLEKQSTTVVRKDEGLTTKEKEALNDIMQRNDRVLKILAQM